MRARIRGTEIYFDVEGVGLAAEGDRMVERPPAFILHGGPGGDHTTFKPSFSALADRLQLIYVDHRGQGRSARGDPATYTLDETVEDMEALRLHLGLGPIISIGTSYGGMVAMAHAARYPASVSQLVLVVTAAHHGFLPAAQRIVDSRGAPEQKKAWAALLAGELTTVERVQDYYMAMGPLYAHRFDKAAYEIGRRRTIPSPEAMNAAFAPGGFLRSFDLRPELRRIVAPTLILAGAHDWICPPEFSEEIQSLIPGSRLEIFENSSHSIRGDEPQRFFGEIRRFLGLEPRE